MSRTRRPVKAPRRRERPHRPNDCSQPPTGEAHQRQRQRQRRHTPTQWGPQRRQRQAMRKNTFPLRLTRQARSLTRQTAGRGFGAIQIHTRITCITLTRQAAGLGLTSAPPPDTQ